MYKVALQFIVSGSIVVLASYAAPRFGQKWAGLIVAAPLLTLLTFIFLSVDGVSGNSQEYLRSALLFMVPAAVFIASLLLLSGRLHYVVNILVSVCIFSLAVLCFYRFKLV